VSLQQVLLNLIANSIDALEDVDHGVKQIHMATTLREDGMVQVSVSDTGIGLDGVDLHRMFELSYTTKATGTGVGLSVSRSIVQAHGGQLWAVHDTSGGATFCFTIPIVTPQPDRVSA
jgi:signal transduction histidine kinase